MGRGRDDRRGPWTRRHRVSRCAGAPTSCTSRRSGHGVRSARSDRAVPRTESVTDLGARRRLTRAWQIVGGWSRAACGAGVSSGYFESEEWSTHAGTGSGSGTVCLNASHHSTRDACSGLGACMHRWIISWARN
jgi:hypothetical protein